MTTTLRQHGLVHPQHSSSGSSPGADPAPATGRSPTRLRFGASLIAIALGSFAAGCAPSEGSDADTACVEEDIDADGDGYLVADDCDDTDASIYPGAPDIWYDGVDSDCAGDEDYDADGDGYLVADDCDDTDPSTYPGAPDAWYDGVDSDCRGDDDYDADGDGFPIDDDCDDGDADIYPGAPDDWYDGIDSDCAGDNDYDADGDGYDLGDDCDDTDASVYPGAPDAWYDGIDSDCAGDNDYDADDDGYEFGEDCDDSDPLVFPNGFGNCPDIVDLGSAENFVILAKSGISTVPESVVTGNIGVSPAAATYITGFSLIADSTNVFSTSDQVIGKVYASNYAAPTPSNLTTAVGDMETAYTDAAGRAADVTELGAGNIGGMTLEAGVYKWGTGVLIPTDLTLSGGAGEIWIFEIAGDLTVSNGIDVSLTGGALPENVFWQVAGLVDLGTTTHFEGVVLTQTAVTMATGASINGRLYAQTAVSLDSSTVTAP